MLLQLFIILSLPHFQNAQIVYFPAAKVPTSWTINPRTSAYDQIILSNGKTNANYGFACGFYSQNDKRSFYLAIGSAAASIDSSGNQVWTFTDNIAWVANRNRPVGEKAELQLLPDGNLVLKDTDGILVWSTDTNNKSVAGMKMMETGNLVLHDGFNNTVWQSFDHPTDKLLPGQKLLAGQKLVASISKTNVSEGDFYVSLTSKGLVAFYDEIMYFSLYFPDFFPEIQTVESIELTVNGTFGVYALTREGLKLLFPFPRFSNYTRMKYDSKGHLRLYDHNSKSADMLRDYVNECDYPTSCGNYGLCSNGRCSCPAGFAQDNVSKAQGYFTCKEINPTACGNPLSHSLLSYENVNYFNYSAGIVKVTDMASYRSQPEECMHLLPIFMQKAKQDQLIDMVDRSNEDMQLHKSEVVEMMKVAIWCLQSNYTRRPSMSKVVKVLEGNMDVKLI
ncbi:hypothetical protein GH714_012092 [Hevea brasiliensis]|uniref:Bulb-type lectin domain-containing protein n=1 Tax=Hevea brasiliensis TaxID=3981 RepID=A0A6A6LR96_HEVBR|nr:hypothetical protein GH714_012092 [Hevea brasiliensis]